MVFSPPDNRDIELNAQAANPVAQDSVLNANGPIFGEISNSVVPNVPQNSEPIGDQHMKSSSDDSDDGDDEEEDEENNADAYDRAVAEEVDSNEPIDNNGSML